MHWTTSGGRAKSQHGRPCSARRAMRADRRASGAGTLCAAPDPRRRWVPMSHAIAWAVDMPCQRPRRETLAPEGGPLSNKRSGSDGIQQCQRAARHPEPTRDSLPTIPRTRKGPNPGCFASPPGVQDPALADCATMLDASRDFHDALVMHRVNRQWRGGAAVDEVAQSELAPVVVAPGERPAAGVRCDVVVRTTSHARQRTAGELVNLRRESQALPVSLAKTSLGSITPQEHC
jgi:hypothetical protein